MNERKRFVILLLILIASVVLVWSVRNNAGSEGLVDQFQR